MVVRTRSILFLLAWLLPAIVVGPSAFAESAEQKIPITLLQEIYQNEKLPFNTYEGPGAFDSYLVMNVRFEPIAEILAKIRQALYPNLINRGEAHITVITPPEYVQALKNKLSMREINQIARELEIQKSRFDVLGVGSGKIFLDGRTQETFFLIVQSEDLLQLRRLIYKRFVDKGGDPKSFDPEHFFPHITVGFTKRDLHENDGVIKDVQHSLDPRFFLVN